jgi:hypothetical protein
VSYHVSILGSLPSCAGETGSSKGFSKSVSLQYPRSTSVYVWTHNIMRTLNTQYLTSVLLVPTPYPVHGCSKKNGAKHTTLYSALVGNLLYSTVIFSLTRPSGPPQPSMVYRYLRTLEGVSPPLSLTHLACQTTAKAFIATRKFILTLYRSVSDFFQYLIECSLWG